MPSSRGSPQSKDQTWVSYVPCVGRWVITGATWGAPNSCIEVAKPNCINVYLYNILKAGASLYSQVHSRAE